jgi:DNA-binding MarR family transcriptional regulator
MDYEKLAAEFVKLFGRMERQKARKKVTDSMHGEQFILFYLSAHESIATPSDICREMGISSARIAAALNRMEEKGLVTRRIDTHDRRRILVDLTESGRTEVEKRKSEVRTTTANMMRYLGEDDAKELVRIMKRLSEVTPDDFK